MACYCSVTTRVALVLVALAILAGLGFLARLPVAAGTLATILILHILWRRARGRRRDQVSRVGNGTPVSAPRAYHVPYVLNWLAVVALVLGFVGHALDWLVRQRLLQLALVFAGAAGTSWVVGVVLARWRPALRAGSGLSAIVVALLVALLSLMALPVGITAIRDEAKRQCYLNVEQLTVALQAYSDRSGGVLPDGATWCDRVSRDLDSKASLTCPAAGSARSGYAFNSFLSGVDVATLQDAQDTVVIFESDAGWNAAGGPELLPADPRHYRGDIYGFADRHVEWIHRKRLGTDEDGNPIWAKEPVRDVIWEPVLKESEGEAPAPADP